MKGIWTALGVLAVTQILLACAVIVEATRVQTPACDCPQREESPAHVTVTPTPLRT